MWNPQTPSPTFAPCGLLQALWLGLGRVLLPLALALLGALPLPAQAGLAGLDLGSRWVVTEHNPDGTTWDGSWLRRGQTPVFDALWRHSGTKAIVKDIVEIRALRGQEVEVYRQGNKGTYRGALAPDQLGIPRGTATWMPATAWWEARIVGATAKVPPTAAAPPAPAFATSPVPAPPPAAKPAAVPPPPPKPQPTPPPAQSVPAPPPPPAPPKAAPAAPPPAAAPQEKKGILGFLGKLERAVGDVSGVVAKAAEAVKDPKALVTVADPAKARANGAPGAPTAASPAQTKVAGAGASDTPAPSPGAPGRTTPTEAAPSTGAPGPEAAPAQGRTDSTGALGAPLPSGWKPLQTGPPPAPAWGGAPQLVKSPLPTGWKQNENSTIDRKYSEWALKQPKAACPPNLAPISRYVASRWDMRDLNPPLTFTYKNHPYQAAKALRSIIRVELDLGWVLANTRDLLAAPCTTHKEDLGRQTSTREIEVNFPNLGVVGKAVEGTCAPSGTDDWLFWIHYRGVTTQGTWVDLLIKMHPSAESGYDLSNSEPEVIREGRRFKERTALEILEAVSRPQAIAFVQQLKIAPEALPSGQPSEAMEFTTDPAAKRSLVPDGKDGVYLKARALPTAGEKPDSVAKRTQAITFAAVGAGQAWVDFGTPALDGLWKKVYVQASNPDKVRGSRQVPPSVELQATLKGEKQASTKNLTLALAANPEIDAKPDVVEFTLQSGQTADVKVTIDNPGPDKWEFRTEYDRQSRPLAKVTLKPTDGSHAVLSLKEAGLDALHDGSNTEYATLRILAEQKGRDPLERDIKVGVAQEGLFVAGTGRDAQTRRFNVSADGKAQPRDIDFRIFAQDPTTRKILNLTKTPATLQQVTIECLEEPTTLAGRLISAGQLTWQLAGIRPSNQPSAILRLAFAKELPSDGRTIPCDFRISYTGGKEESFTAIVTIGIVTTANGPGGRDWQIELEKCQAIIRKFVPAAYQPKLREMLDRRKLTLGPEGLHALRERLWRAASELTLGEGGQGYADEARWANYITESLEWTQWAGDLAFTAAIGTVTGPYGALGASSLKGLVISAITAYQDGQSTEEWLWGNLSTLPGILEGKIIDPDTFEQLGMQSKAKIWAVFVSYHFLKNLYQGQTVVEALKSTAKEAAGNLLGSWLGAEVKKNGQRSASGWATDKLKGAGRALAAPTKVGKVTPASKTASGGTAGAKPPQASGKQATAKGPSEAQGGRKPGATEPGAPATKPSPGPDDATAPSGAATKADATPTPKAADSSTQGPLSDSAKLVQQGMRRAGDGEHYANKEDVLTIMRDPSMVRALKKAPPELQEAFSNTRESLYRQHDHEVVQFVKDSVPGMKYRMVKVIEFRTPGADGPSLNTDRDYRVCYYGGRDPNTGQEMWIEVPRKHWEDHSYKTFSELTGGPNGTPTQNREWAAEHQQLATDRYHPEASPAFTDQKTVWNPKTRQFDKVQVTSNITRVGKNQQEGLDVSDPQALGQMYVVKVKDARFRHEALVQANKAVTALTELRQSYSVQGRAVGSLPEKFVQGMAAVTTACDRLKADPNCRDPKAIADAERTLRANGFSSLSDFMEKMSGQFESLKFMPYPKN